MTECLDGSSLMLLVCFLILVWTCLFVCP